MRRALGKGLSQLIAEQFEGGPNEVPIDSIIRNPRQPRSHFDDGALSELSSSIKEFGILQPLVVRPSTEGQYELIAGERRLRAAKLAGLEAVPVLIRSAGNQNSLEIALIENIQREDINSLECARAYRRLMDEFGLTQEQVAERVGKSRVAIANAVRLLRLPRRIQDGIEGGKISEGHARALLTFESDAHQLAVYDQILERNLTVRDVEKAASGLPKKSGKKKKGDDSPRDPNLAELQRGLSNHLGSPVHITSNGKGGSLSIDFYSDDDLQRILDVIGFSL